MVTDAARLTQRSSSGTTIDTAALFGAMLAAAITLTLGEGAWSWFSSALGVALLLTLLSFYIPPHPAQTGRRRVVASAAAAGAIVLTLILAWPLQSLLNRYTQLGDYCRFAGEVVAIERHDELRDVETLSPEEATVVPRLRAFTADDLRRSVDEAYFNAQGACLGGVTTTRLYSVTLPAFIALFGVLEYWSRRKKPPELL